MTKRKSLSSQSTTLLDFFPPRQGSSKKPKREPAAPQFPSNALKPSSSFKPKSEEIIVITDSEDDEEIQECTSTITEIPGNVNHSRAQANTECNDSTSKDEQSISDDRPTPSTCPVLSFGKQILLLEERSGPPEPSTANSGEDQEGAETDEQMNITANWAEDEGASMYVSPPDNEWGTGDDEVLTTFSDEELEDDSEQLQLMETETESSCSSDTNNCPLCGKLLSKLSHLEIEQHVNQCLDGLKSDETTMNSTQVASSSSVKLPDQSSVVNLKPLRAPLAPLATHTNAFSILMSGNKENEAWKEATEAESRSNARNGAVKPWIGRRHAPFYKVMQGMPIAVDAFRYGKIPGVTAYLLTHAHSDHYTNLSSNWKSGPIYCSETTANLIVHMLKVDSQWVHPLPMDKPFILPDTGGVSVTPIAANHCPGSALFFFEGLQTTNAGDSTFHSPHVGSSRTFRYLHCGDFRACPEHVMHPAVRGKKLDLVYLDTTYLDPKYCFPPQPEVISACASLSRRIVLGVSDDESQDCESKVAVTSWLTKGSSGDQVKQDVKKDDKILVVVGTYSIGKERIVKAIALALSTKIYCDSRKRALLHCQVEDAELLSLLTEDPFVAGVHIVPLQAINPERMDEYLNKWNGAFNKVLGFRPTGWTYTPPAGADMSPNIQNIIRREQLRTYNYLSLRPMRASTPKVMLYGVPYSEHSSFFELTCFALSVNYVKMIATVNIGSASSRAKMSRWFERWESEKKRRRSVGEDLGVAFRKRDYW